MSEILFEYLYSAFRIRVNFLYYMLKSNRILVRRNDRRIKTGADMLLHFHVRIPNNLLVLKESKLMDRRPENKGVV